MLFRLPLSQICSMSGLQKLFRVIAVFGLALVCPAKAQQAAIPAMFTERQPFLEAIEKERPQDRPGITVTGVTVPHHMLAADLIARGFWLAAGGSYERIIVVSPDHFYKSRKPLATTLADIETV